MVSSLIVFSGEVKSTNIGLLLLLLCDCWCLWVRSLLYKSLYNWISSRISSMEVWVKPSFLITSSSAIRLAGVHLCLCKGFFIKESWTFGNTGICSSNSRLGIFLDFTTALTISSKKCIRMTIHLLLRFTIKLAACRLFLQYCWGFHLFWTFVFLLNPLRTGLGLGIVIAGVLCVLSGAGLLWVEGVLLYRGLRGTLSSILCFLWVG